VTRRRRDFQTFSLSFLDVISCGFGAIILLLVLSKIYEPVIIEKTQVDLLFEHMAYRIEESPLVLGSQTAEGERTVPLPIAMPGVSRRHCSVRNQNGQCVLEDHSRYGTFLNGHRIDGSAVLQVGDSVRLGSPGHELELIATEESHGA